MIRENDGPQSISFYIGAPAKGSTALRRERSGHNGDLETPRLS